MSNILKYRIKDLRKEKKVTVISLATKCQVSEKTIRDWELISQNEEKSIPSDKLVIISISLNTPFIDLYTNAELLLA
jgi:transcriptional regulator with XRE-family HTH domain